MQGKLNRKSRLLTKLDYLHTEKTNKIDTILSILITGIVLITLFTFLTIGA